MTKSGSHVDQFELPLSAVLSHSLFPGRAMLNIGEVAKAWGVDNEHVKRLIECGDLIAVDLRTSKPAKPSEIKKEHRSYRQWLRIPTSAFDEFTKSRAV